MVQQIVRRTVMTVAALGVVVVLYGFAHERNYSEVERSALASRFSFERCALSEAPHGPYKFERKVHPSLRRISAWISSVGAAAALGDLDGDGLANDVCYVDPRTDMVIVTPANPEDHRYSAFALSPAPVAYDSATMAPMGCVPADLNEDGRMDLLVYYWGRTPIAYLRNTASSGSERLSAAAYTAVDVAPGGERWFSNAGLVADIDGDGHLDIVIGNYFRDGAHILDEHADGTEELHNTKSKAYNGGSKHLLLWKGASGGSNPTVRFEEARGVFDERVLHGWTLAAGAADLDGDMLPELYFAHDFGPDRLLHNESTPGHVVFREVQGKRGFTTPASCVMGRDSFKGMGVDFGDLNHDGIFDIYVSNIADDFALQESHFLWLSTGPSALFSQGQAPYVNASEKLGLSRSGWGWDARLEDFDNDGELEAVQATGFVRGHINRWPELQALGTGNDQLMHNPRFWPAFRAGDDLSGNDRNAFFARDAGGRFVNIGPEVGFREPMVSRAIAIADIDGDGRQDMVLGNQWGPSYLYRNVSPHPGAFLGLHVLLPLTPRQDSYERAGHPGPDTLGRPAVGAIAQVTLGNGTRLTAQSDGGSGHSGKRSPDIHFGLGNTSPNQSLDVEIRWRDPSGVVRREKTRLRPGWHTIVLAWPV